MKKLIILTLATYVILTFNYGLCQSCLPGMTYFTTQAQIDSFPINYPDCHEIEGSVVIYGNDITNLNAFSAITKFSYELMIGFCPISVGIPRLKNLSGLDNVTYIGELSICYADSLNSIAALESLCFLGGLSINFCGKLLSLEGLNSLDTIHGSVGLRLSSLENLSDLENLKYIDGGLGIYGCSQLRNLSYLSNLGSINGQLRIGSNYRLNSLTGLDNIVESSIDYLYITGNDSLSECDITSICEYLNNPNANAWITDNYTGCNSGLEVVQACGIVNLENLESEAICSASPNPFTSTTTISLKLNKSSSASIHIFNSQGQLVDLIEQRLAAGKQEIIWNSEGLPGGMYFVTIETDGYYKREKVVKIK